MVIDAALEAKRDHLYAILASLERAAVAFSGGVDSSYLLAACLDVLGPERVVAFTADSPLLPRSELETAKEIVALLGATHRIIPFDDLSLPEVASNPPRRCYYCKRARFEALIALAHEVSGAPLLHGENADDHLDYRPGAAAAQELHERAPLAEAGLTKADIRALSRARGLPTWDAPAAACLASRFPYNIPLTREGLQRVEQAEEAAMRISGVRQLRVRDHFPVARLETPPNEIARLAQSPLREELAHALRAVGYHYVALDLIGYRMGSLNEELVTK